MAKCFYVDLGMMDYREALSLQERLVDLRGRNQIEDVLLILEHDPVITIGTKELPLFRVPRDEIEKRGLKVIDVSRGGGATYHGPEQLVAYPITDFRRMFGYKGGNDIQYSDIKKFTDRLQDVMRLTLLDFGIANTKLEKGVWYEDKKIGSRAIEIRKSGGTLVTMHGSALDVNTEQENFELIFPCGHANKGVTSMEKVLGRKIPMEDVKTSFLKNFGTVFSYEMEKTTVDELLLSAGDNAFGEQLAGPVRAPDKWA